MVLEDVNHLGDFIDGALDGGVYLD